LLNKKQHADYDQNNTLTDLVHSPRTLTSAFSVRYHSSQSEFRGVPSLPIGGNSARDL
ncbi:hypothetical protein T11_9510, partial [Trichinella zimbabwensis]